MYTHYWYQRRDFTRDEWQRIVATFQKMRENLPYSTASGGGYYQDEPLAIAGADGAGEPTADAMIIMFNGAAPLAGETFLLVRLSQLYHDAYDWDPEENAWFNFCKTGRRPYDLVVCALLLAMTAIAPDAIQVSSDGDMQGLDWLPARNYLKMLEGTKEDEPWQKP